MYLFFRADASTQIGSGHVMRCLALAQAWQDAAGKAIFLMATDAPAVEAHLQVERIEVQHLQVVPGSIEDAKETANSVSQVGAKWVVLDGYHFDAEYQRILKDSGFKLLCIDDCGHAEHYYADLILNQNISADEHLYVSREPYSQLLLGTGYTLLRREFSQWQGWQRETPSVARKILVTLGGSDPNNATFKVILALQQVEIEGLEVIVVVGGSNPHYEQLQTAVQMSPFPIFLKRNVTNMPELMAWADLAIAAGGSTNWELAFMGLPSIAIILADNQRGIAETLDRQRVVVNLGWYESVTVSAIKEAIEHLSAETQNRLQMTAIGQKVVDGDGVTRVISAINI
jgi:UDP-2,4-diacetamido-2,4,6-trideoxy-beta-L-altropyranose hydrolase